MKKMILLTLTILCLIGVIVILPGDVQSQEVQNKEKIIKDQVERPTPPKPKENLVPQPPRKEDSIGVEIKKIYRLKIWIKSEQEQEIVKGIGLLCEGKTECICHATEEQVEELIKQGIEFKVEHEGLNLWISEDGKGSVYACNDTDYNIPDNDDWRYSPIPITLAPSGRTVSSIDMRYDIYHTYIGDLIVQLVNQNLSHTLTLWNRQGGSGSAIHGDTSGITTFNGELVNQTWKLRAKDCAPSDTGYIECFDITIWFQDLMPDLIVQSLTASNYNPQAGSSIDVTMVIKNQGSGSASSTFWNGLFYNLSSPPTINTIEDQCFSISSLDPGSSQSHTFYNVTSYDVGTWHMYGLADCDGQITETNESNNYKGPVDINWTAPPQPDLIIQSLTPSSSNPTVGDTISVTLVVKNQGGSSTGSFRTDLFKNRSSAPVVPSNGDYAWSTSLGVGQIESHVFTGITSSTPGTWHMYGLTDSQGQIQESNENNNVAGPVDVVWKSPQPKADLIVEEVCVGNYQPEVGDSVNVMVVIKNQGEVTAVSFWTDLYYNRTSPPVLPDVGDDYFSTTSLAPGETKAYPFYIGNEEAESWSMYVSVDSWIDVNESNENNNVWGPEYVTWSWPAKGGPVPSPGIR